MARLARSFECIKEPCKTLVVQMVVIGAVYIALVVVVVYMFNYFDPNYYYWIPALAIVFLGIGTWLLIYLSSKYAAASQLEEQAASYSTEFAKRALGHHKDLVKINSNIAITSK